MYVRSVYMARDKRKEGAAEPVKALSGLYPARSLVDEREAHSVDLPASAASYFVGAGSRSGVLSPVDPFACGNATLSGEEARLARELPLERVARYASLESMARDPTIDSALKMHIGHALSVKSDSWEAVAIDPVEPGGDKIVDELKAVLQQLINEQIGKWGYNAALYGTAFVRVYGEQGKGILNVRSDYYTHPRFIKKYEKAGQLAGFTTSHQGASPEARSRQIMLLPPWSFVEFQIPTWQNMELCEPTAYGAIPVDLSIDGYDKESIVESNSYGESLIATAYQPWLDLLNAVDSMNMSRKNAARLERLIGVNTGRLDPERAANYLNMMSSQLVHTEREMARQSYRRGFVQTVINRLIPIFGDTKGRLDINTVQGTPDISGLEGVNFHIKRLGGALGIDPAMLGFADFLSGGLGDGGFMRVSIMAAMKAQSLRKAIFNGVQRLCELHVAYKYGKVFLPEDQPWKITFNSVSTALEREERETLESSANVAGTLAGILATIDQDFGVTDKRAFLHFVWTDVLKRDEESFELVCPQKGPPKGQTPAADGEDLVDGDDK